MLSQAPTRQSDFFSPTFSFAKYMGDNEPEAPAKRQQNRVHYSDPASGLSTPPSEGQSIRGLKLNVNGLGVNRQTSAPKELNNCGTSTNFLHLGGGRYGHRRRSIADLFSSLPFSAIRKPFNDFSLQPLNPVDPVDRCKEDFMLFMVDEFKKVEEFYKSKGEQAGERLRLLRMQLQEMRRRRAEEIYEAQRQLETASPKGGSKWIGRAKEKMNLMGTNGNSKSHSKYPHTPIHTALPDGRRDFVPKPENDNIPYATAKAKIRQAFEEYYRGLTLLKSYADLNRTAFRKLNKKFDKAVNENGGQRFMNDYVDKAWFANSTLIDEYSRTTEDLYTRYFEKGNTKEAYRKLRAHKVVADHSRSAFQNGLLIGIGCIFAIQGLIQAIGLLSTNDPDLGKVVQSHMQLYAGYFFVLMLFFIFCLVCWIWTKTQVNYPVIFELDSTSRLDWRRLAEFPSFFTFLFGIIFWLNFNGYASNTLFLWYPMILICVSLFIIILPLPILHYKSRLWIIAAHVSCKTPSL
jgi:xenotropic and polytropic retrovirus receptor 1